MKRLVLMSIPISVCLCALLFAAAGQAAAPSEVPNRAWDKLRWGMTPQEAGAVLGRLVVRIDEPGRYTHRLDGQYKGYNLAFSFFGSRLERIALMDAGTPGMTERAERLEELLILKYGAPFREDMRNGVHTREWLVPDRLIQLYSRGGRNPALNLIYTWRQSAMTEEY